MMKNSFEDSLKRYSEEWRKEILEAFPWERMREFIPENGNIAELYCGGSLENLIGLCSLVGPKGKVFAIDVEEIRKDELNRNLIRLRAWIPETPLKAESLDAIVIDSMGWVYAIGLTSNKERHEFKEEVLRTLKPGGYFIIKDDIRASYYNMRGKSSPVLIEELFGGTLTSTAEIQQGQDKQVTVFQKVTLNQ